MAGRQAMPAMREPGTQTPWHVFEADKAEAVDTLNTRLDGIADHCGELFPLYRPADSAVWKLSRRGSWLGGLWSGCWWQRAAQSGSPRHLAHARASCQRLESMLAEPSLNRSFVFAYGAALGSERMECPEAHALAVRAAAALAEDYRPALGGWLLGPGLGAGEHGARTLDIDALAPTLALLHLPGDDGLQAMAHSHLRMCLRHLATASGAWAHQSSIGLDGVWQTARPGAWARGQAWAMLGLAEAVRHMGDAYAEPAEQACRYWVRRWGEAACGALPDPAELDGCAVTIASLALLRLARLLPESAALREQACRQNARLAAQVRETGCFAGHYYRTGARSQCVESPCASFFLLEALAEDLRGA